MAKKKTIEILGLEELQRDIEKAVKELPPGLEKTMGKATLVVERRAKQVVVVDTGRLRASIAPEVRQVGGNVRGIVGSNVKYAPFIELGTRRMRARPYLVRALMEKTEAVMKILGDFVSRVADSIERG